jgi:hypothetical protein
MDVMNFVLSSSGEHTESFEIRELRRILETERVQRAEWRKLRYEEVYDLYSSQIATIIN